MTRKRKQKCIKGLSASASSRLRKRVRDELLASAQDFVEVSQEQMAMDEDFNCPRDMWVKVDVVVRSRARYNRARALAAECGV